MLKRALTFLISLGIAFPAFAKDGTSPNYNQVVSALIKHANHLDIRGPQEIEDSFMEDTRFLVAQYGKLASLQGQGEEFETQVNELAETFAQRYELWAVHIARLTVTSAFGTEFRYATLIERKDKIDRFLADFFYALDVYQPILSPRAAHIFQNVMKVELQRMIVEQDARRDAILQQYSDTRWSIPDMPLVELVSELAVAGLAGLDALMVYNHINPDADPVGLAIAGVSTFALSVLATRTVFRTKPIAERYWREVAGHGHESVHKRLCSGALGLSPASFHFLQDLSSNSDE